MKMNEGISGRAIITSAEDGEASQLPPGPQPPEEVLDITSPKDAVTLSCAKGECKLVCKDGFYILRVEREDGGSADVLSSEAYLPPGKYRVYVYTKDGAYSEPLAVDVPKEPVGTAVARVGDRKYTITMYNDGTWEQSEEKVRIADQIGHYVLETKGGVSYQDFRALDFRGYVYNVNYKPNGVSEIPKQMKFTLVWKIPILYLSKLGTATATAELSFKYSEEPSLELRGLKLYVKPADCAFSGDCEVVLTFSSPLGKSEPVSVTVSDEIDLDLLRLYDANKDKIGRGLLYEVSAELRSSDKQYLSKKFSIETPSDLAKHPEKYKIKIGERSAESEYFPLKLSTSWSFLDAGDQHEEYCVECDLSEPQAPQELAKLVERFDVALSAVFPAKEVVLVSRERYPLADTEVEVVDCDGQRLKLDQLKGRVPLWLVHTGKIEVRTNAWARLRTRYQDLIVTPLVDKPKKVQYKDLEFLLVPSNDTIELLGSDDVSEFWMSLEAPLTPEGRPKAEFTAVSPFKEIRGEHKDGKIVLNGCCVSAGLLNLRLVYTDLSGEQKEEKREVQVGGVKDELSAEVPAPDGFQSLSLEATYLVKSYDGYEEVYKGPVPLDTAVQCIKSDQGVLKVDPDCVLGKLQAEAVLAEPVWKVKVSLPDSLPSFIKVRVDDRELAPGDSTEIEVPCKQSYAEVVAEFLGFRRVLRVEAPQPSVSITKDGVRVQQFGCAEEIPVSITSINCWTEKCGSSVQLKLTRSRPEITLSDIAEAFMREGEAPKTVAVRVLDQTDVLELPIEVKGSWDSKVEVSYAGIPGQIYIMCRGRKYKYPDEVKYVKSLCPAVAVFKSGSAEFTYMLGRPKLVLTLAGDKAEIQSDPMYFKSWRVRVKELRKDLSLSVLLDKELGAETVQVPVDQDALSVLAEAYVNGSVVAVQRQDVYGVFDARFKQEGALVHITVIGSFAQTTPVELIAVDEAGNKYLLWREAWAGLSIYDIDVDLSAFKGTRIVKLCVAEVERQVCYDVAYYQVQSQQSEGSPVHSIITALSSLLRRGQQ